MLDVADSAVDHFEAVGGGAGAKVLALDERSRVAAECGLTRGRSAGRAAAHDQHIEFTAGQLRKVSMHLLLSAPRPLPACDVDAGMLGSRNFRS